jgi:2-hydroxy-6-oxonona-2,4-dienedioate hydrolase
VSARRVTLASGLQVRAVEADAGGGGPPVLLVHGWGCTAFLWRHVLPALGAAGYRAIAVDLPGHGLSDKPDDPGAYALPTMAGWVAEAIAALALEWPVLVGHSMGGAIVREVAGRATVDARAVVLCAPAGFGRIRRLATGRFFSPEWAVPLLGPTAVPRWAVKRSLQRVRGPRGPVPDDEVDQYWAPSQDAAFVRASRHLLHHFTWDPPPPATLAALRARPLLVVLGTVDRLVVARDTARYLEAVPEADVRWLEGAGHVPMEDSPDAFNGTLLGWLAAHGIGDAVVD